jgi:hypothetical protein
MVRFSSAFLMANAAANYNAPKWQGIKRVTIPELKNGRPGGTRSGVNQLT